MAKLYQYYLQIQFGYDIDINHDTYCHLWHVPHNQSNNKGRLKVEEQNENQIIYHNKVNTYKNHRNHHLGR